MKFREIEEWAEKYKGIDIGNTDARVTNKQEFFNLIGKEKKDGKDFYPKIEIFEKDPSFKPRNKYN